MLVQPRAGVALIDEHIGLLKYLETEGEADLLPTTIDAYTRQNRYAEAAKGIEKSITSGTSMLNGFPAVNHGVERLPPRDRERVEARADPPRHARRPAAGRDHAGGRIHELRRAAAFPTIFPM